jgi:hypothetical protein
MGTNCAVDRDGVGSGHEGHERGGAAAAENASEGETGGHAREQKDKYPDPRREMPGRQELKSMGEERFYWGVQTIRVENLEMLRLPLSSPPRVPPSLSPTPSSLTIHAVRHTHTLVCAGIIPMSNIARPKSGPRLQTNSALSGGGSRPGSRMGARGTGSPASMQTLALALWDSTPRMHLFLFLATHFLACLHSLSLPLLRHVPCRCPLAAGGSKEAPGSRPMTR